jgi:SAM-dependent methyltransferase
VPSRAPTTTTRPAYPDAAVDAALAGTPERPRVLDLGAGTGKLTRVLTARGLDVVAVEPDPAMLAVLRERSPGVEARTGSAERIPLPDGHLDAVLVGQALHWFDLDRAAPEMARVLRPGGVLAGLWNGGDDDVAWIREFGELTVRGRRVPDNPAGGGDATPHPGSPWFVDDGEDRVTWGPPDHRRRAPRRHRHALLGRCGAPRRTGTRCSPPPGSS